MNKILSKLNPFFSKSEEVVVVGGGIAGSCCATILSRANVSVTMVDADPVDSQREFVTHNLVTRDGATKHELIATAQEDFLKYPSSTLENSRVKSVQVKNGQFETTLSNNKMLKSKYVLIATGANYNDEILRVPGAQKIWGTSLFNCPYCHLYEFSGKEIAIITNHTTATSYQKLVGQWTKLSHVFPNAEMPPKTDDTNYPFVNGKITEFKSMENGKIEITYGKNSSQLRVDAIFAPGLTQSRNPLLENLEVEFESDPSWMHLPKVSPSFETSIPNLFVAGDARSGFANLTGAPSHAMAVAVNVIGKIVADKEQIG